MSNFIAMKSQLSQEQAPLFDELISYSTRPLLPFHTPGHKAGLGMEPEWFQPGVAVGIDLTEITAFDWSGALERAQRLAAQFFHSDQSFFLTQGASQGIIGALAGLFAPGDKILVARNCHLSVIKGIILAGVDPLFIETEALADWGIPAGLNEAALKNNIAANPEVKGLVVTNPTYQGIATRINRYREIIGKRILIVDEAHGGHLEWSGFSGYDAYTEADVWVHGTHKMMGSLTQTGILHLRRGKIRPYRIRQGLDLISTTSPSYVLLASLDSNRRFLAKGGYRLFRERLPELQTIRSQIAALKGVRILSDDMLSPAQISDPWKITLSFNEAGLSGYQAAAIMEKDFRIQPEYADLNQITCFVAPWQEQETMRELFRAVAAIGRDRIKPNPIKSLSFPVPPRGMPVREAALAPKTVVSFDEAGGRIAAAIVAPYPPGIPALVPGELIGKEALETLKEVLALGGVVRGLEPGNKIVVVKENR